MDFLLMQPLTDYVLYVQINVKHVLQLLILALIVLMENTCNQPQQIVKMIVLKKVTILISTPELVCRVILVFVLNVLDLDPMNVQNVTTIII
jgi:hypothetical protein